MFSIVVLSVNLNLISAWETGIATHYGNDAGGNACGNPEPMNDWLATGGDQWDYGYGCGACYQIKCKEPAQGGGCKCYHHNPVTVQLINRCVS